MKERRSITTATLSRNHVVTAPESLRKILALNFVSIND
jgi:hypothetical protein